MRTTTMALPAALRDEIKAEAEAEGIPQWQVLDRAWREHKRQQFLASVAAIEFDQDYLDETRVWQDADLASPAGS